MTTHLRARAAQAGALLAVVAGGIAVAPAVALASPPDVQIINLNTEVETGGTLSLQYQVTDTNNGGGQPATAAIRVSGMRCSGECGQITQIDQNGRQFNAQLTAPAVAAGQTRDVEIQVTATINGESRSAESTVTVRGPDKPESARQVSGRVRDQDGKGIAGAEVGLKDSQGHQYEATTNGSGRFAFTASDSKPIAPGNIFVGATKDGYKGSSVTVQASADGTVNVPLTLTALAASPSASASASASASPSPEPSEPASEEPTTENSVAADPDTKATAGTDEGGGSLLFIIIGGLLVAAGVGAIVLVVMRRKNSGDDDGDDDPAGKGPGGVVPPGPGRFDATRVATPASAAAATMIAPRSGAPSMADAPTVLQSPVPAVEDEFPDPYGVPMPQQGSYAGASTGGWDNQPAGYEGNAYGPPTQFGQPVDEAYGANDAYAAAPSGGYGYAGAPAEQRYDEPTGMYRPGAEPDAGYGYDQGGYDSTAADGQYDGQQYDGQYAGQQYDGQYAGQQYGGEYDNQQYDAGQQYGGGFGEPEPAPAGQAAGYGTWDAPGGVDDNAPAYAPATAGNYGAPAAGQYAGYPDADGYAGDQAGYGPPPAGGYDQAGYEQGGYGEQQYGEQPAYDQRAGYGEQTGRHGGPPRQEPSHQGQRHAADWNG